MVLDVELYRRTVYAPAVREAQGPRRISVIDIHPAHASRTLLFVHGYGGSALQWLYQLRFFGQTIYPASSRKCAKPGIDRGTNTLHLAPGCRQPDENS